MTAGDASLSARSVDFSAARDAVRSAVDRKEIPGAVALVRWQGSTVLHEAAGWAALEPERRVMKHDTIFDLASLTKPLATTPLVLQLVDREIVSLDDPVRHYLPLMERFAGGQVTIRQLLTHTSGLPAWNPLYIRTRSRNDVLEIMAATKPVYEPGSGVIYSCLSFIVLGLLVETLTGSALDDVASQWLFDPLDLRDTGYGPRVDRERCAWTERGSAHEQALVATCGMSFDGWREDYIVGTVHDGNAWYAMGGISGNAGLFGTAHDVGLLGQMWLNRGSLGQARVLREQTVRDATTDGTAGLNEARGLGWQMYRQHDDGHDSDATESQSAAPAFGAHAFGHTGFTGTSIWVDPDLDLVAVLLTNRVHPKADNGAHISTLRDRFHVAVATSVRGASLRVPM